MRNALVLTTAFLATAYAQEPPAPPAEVKPAPTAPKAQLPTFTLPPEIMNALGNLWVVTLPVSGTCVIPMGQVPVRPGVEYSGKVVKPNTTPRMRATTGPPICGTSK